jgi:hypothetical protein
VNEVTGVGRRVEPRGLTCIADVVRGRHECLDDGFVGRDLCRGREGPAIDLDGPLLEHVQ